MARTTPALVQEIREWDDTTFPSLTPFINAASNLITRVCDPKYDTADADDIATLTIIETWLAAHFYSVADNPVAGSRVGPLYDTYQYKVDLNLASTEYGQTAMIMDVSGALANWNEVVGKGSPEVGATWLGEAFETAEPFDGE